MLVFRHELRNEGLVRPLGGIASNLQQAVDGEYGREAAGQTAPVGVNYFADTGPFTQAGITSVLFGAGDIAQAHTADEYLDLDQLFLAAEIILTLLTENAGRPIVEA